MYYLGLTSRWPYPSLPRARDAQHLVLRARPCPLQLVSRIFNPECHPHASSRAFYQTLLLPAAKVNRTDFLANLLNCALALTFSLCFPDPGFRFSVARRRKVSFDDFRSKERELLKKASFLLFSFKRKKNTNTHILRNVRATFTDCDFSN
jgi:hypothetical protein